jgi:hypothetical protein
MTSMLCEIRDGCIEGCVVCKKKCNAIDLARALLHNALGALLARILVQDQALIFEYRHSVHMSHDVWRTGVTRPTSPTGSSPSSAYSSRTMQPHGPPSPVSHRLFSECLDQAASS